MVMIDARGFLGDGGGDKDDWQQIAYGPHGMTAHHVKYWTDPNTGACAPIKGLFEPGCSLSAATAIQERVHVLGFVCEQTFASGEIRQKAVYCCNLARFDNKQAARDVMALWPLVRNTACS